MDEFSNDHNKLFNLKNRTIFITGASSGIGKTLSIGLARSGATVIGVGRDQEKLMELEEQVKKLGGVIYTVASDVTIEDEINDAVQWAVKKFKKIDGAVLAAGINIRKPVFELSLDEYHKVLQTNLDGVFITSKAVAMAMVDSNSHGSIVNISSLASHLAYSNNSAYSASKSGVSQLTKVCAVEWADYGIRVNSICPGRIKTPLIESVLNDEVQKNWTLSRIPMKRLGTTEELIGPTMFLLSDASSYITGISLFVDGGWGVSA